MKGIEVSILEYLGTLEDGVLTIISIMYDDQYFEGTFFYTDLDDKIKKIEILID